VARADALGGSSWPLLERAQARLREASAVEVSLLEAFVSGAPSDLSEAVALAEERGLGAWPLCRAALAAVRAHPASGHGASASLSASSTQRLLEAVAANAKAGQAVQSAQTLHVALVFDCPAGHIDDLHSFTDLMRAAFEGGLKEGVGCDVHLLRLLDVGAGRLVAEVLFGGAPSGEGLRVLKSALCHLSIQLALLASSRGGMGATGGDIAIAGANSLSDGLLGEFVRLGLRVLHSHAATALLPRQQADGLQDDRAMAMVSPSLVSSCMEEIRVIANQQVFPEGSRSETPRLTARTCDMSRCSYEAPSSIVWNILDQRCLSADKGIAVWEDGVSASSPLITSAPTQPLLPRDLLPGAVEAPAAACEAPLSTGQDRGSMSAATPMEVLSIAARQQADGMQDVDDRAMDVVSPSLVWNCTEEIRAMANQQVFPEGARSETPGLTARTCEVSQSPGAESIVRQLLGSAYSPDTLSRVGATTPVAASATESAAAAGVVGVWSASRQALPPFAQSSEPPSMVSASAVAYPQDTFDVVPGRSEGSPVDFRSDGSPVDFRSPTPGMEQLLGHFIQDVSRRASDNAVAQVVGAGSVGGDRDGEEKAKMAPP